MSRGERFSKMMNNKGKGSALAIIIILIVAVLIAYFIVSQMGGFGFGSGGMNKNDQVQQENVVEQAQDAVDALNSRIQQQYGENEKP